MICKYRSHGPLMISDLSFFLITDSSETWMDKSLQCDDDNLVTLYSIAYY